MSSSPAWVKNGRLLWQHRRLLVRTTAVSAALALALAFIIPPRFESTARIMPPANTNSGSAMLAAVAGRALGGGANPLSSLAGSLLGTGNTTALYIDLIKSGTVSGRLIDRFHLQDVYGKRYRIDTAKKLAQRTTVSEDKKSGVITITVQDTDRVRARDMAQAYLDELNLLLTRTAATSARQERIFLEHRLQGAHADLAAAQKQLSNFSSSNTTVDIKEQTRAMVDAMARVQGELIVEQSSLSSLRQVYGDENVRVRSAQSRISSLQQKLSSLAGPAEAGNAPATTAEQPYPALRRLPQLAVPYADLYRNLRVQETVFELLTQEYELARLQEAKDIPVVSVIDFPGVAEKKAFPPRTVLILSATAAGFLLCCGCLLVRERWLSLPSEAPHKVFLLEVSSTFMRRIRRDQGGAV